MTGLAKKYFYLIIPVIYAILPYNLSAQNDLNAIAGWQHFESAPNSFYQHLSGQAYDL